MSQHKKNKVQKQDKICPSDISIFLNAKVGKTQDNENASKKEKCNNG